MEQFLPTDHDVLQEMRRVKRHNKRKRLLWGLLIWSAIAAAAGWYIFNRYYTLAVVNGPGMNDTLLSGSVVLCRRTVGQAPKKGDVILFQHGTGWQIKRVAALAGDQIAMSQKGKLWINGKALEGYTTGTGADADLQRHPLTVPDGEVFVLGDAYGASVDSRSAAFGTVPVEDVIGVMEYTVWPLYRADNPFQKK